MTKKQLIDRVRRAKARFDRTLGRLDDEALRRVPPGWEWTGAQQLSHVAVWHTILAARLRGDREEDLLGIDPGRYRALGVDGINALMHERNRERPVAGARREFEDSFGQVMAALEAVDEEALARPYRPDVSETVLVDVIAGDTWEHYEEHQPALEALARRA